MLAGRSCLGVGGLSAGAARFSSMVTFHDEQDAPPADEPGLMPPAAGLHDSEQSMLTLLNWKQI